MRNRIHQVEQAAAPIINQAGQVTLQARADMEKVRQAWAADKALLAPMRFSLAGRLALLAAGQRRIAEAVDVIKHAMGEFTMLSQRLGGVGGDLPLQPAPGLPAVPPQGVLNLGPIAGTGADPGVPGMGATDLGEIVRLPDGRLVSVFGDSFTGDKVGEGEHYRSVAVPITGFDELGKPIYGEPFNLPGGPGSPNVLFPPPPEALALDPNMNTLPGGSIVVNGKTYMMVSGTSGLKPNAGSWLVEVTNDPAAGWQPVPGSWRPWQPGNVMGAPSQISGYQSSKDGMVYIAANSFDRSQGVSMFRVDPANAADRGAWQPWTGSGWGTPTEAPVSVSGQQTYGELSFREVDGRPVLSAFNSTPGVYEVQVRVGDNPVDIFNSANSPIVAAQTGIEGTPNYVWQPYGGFIMPGSTLDNLNLLVSQWDTRVDPASGVPFGAPYNTQQIIVNAAPPR
ncbi:hypothetical protein MBOU_01930 [Mycobacterium bourgelatii]|uniref:DUF4185 domain-containing protein n=2 Tax=Mycobacterium bourgelatii TaxID=1273442 RepID=A0A7I9YHJ1_MYCBU|nr:hypothetical protein MBOU_01930 [Mycobacterium bourgelatii]